MHNNGIHFSVSALADVETRFSHLFRAGPSTDRHNSPPSTPPPSLQLTMWAGRRVVLSVSRCSIGASMTAKPSGLRQSGIFARSMPSTVARQFCTTNSENNDDEPLDQTFEQILPNIDTTLTPEQQAYVEGIKKKMKGGQGKRCKVFID